jgi:signal transduction histidine kinase/Tfp pilus assembly protein PilF
MKLKTSLPIILVFLCLLFNSSELKAQKEYFDSLEQVLESDVHDTLKIPILRKLSFAYNDIDIDRGFFFAQQLLETSQRNNDDLNVGIAYNILAMNFLRKDYSLDSIMEFANKSLKLAQKTKSLRLKTIVSNTMALAYEKFGQKEKAFSLYQQAFITAEEMGNSHGAVRCLGNMAAVLDDNNDLEEAKKYYLKAIQYARKLEDEVMASQLGNNLASVYQKENKLDSALVLYEKSVEINRAAEEYYFLSISLANIGGIKTKKKEYELASTYLNESYEIAQKIKNTYCMGIALSKLCGNYAAQKNHSRVIKTANEALDILGTNGDISVRNGFYKHLSSSYEAQKNYELALKNQRLYDSFSDSLYNVEKINQINSLKITYEVAQKETENKLLKAEKEVTSKSIRNKNFVSIGLILALLVGMGFTGLIYKSSQERKKLNEILEFKVAERTEALQIANKNLEQANYELRAFNFISSHDIKEPIRNIGTYAGFIFKQLPNNLQTNLASHFDFIKQSTTQLYTLIEDFAHYTSMSKTQEAQLQPVNLNNLVDGLELALVTSIQKYNGTIINNGLPIISSNSSLLYIAIKNLIENGLKFNQSTQPTVHLSYEETASHHKIIVSDNGIGIEEDYHSQIFEMFKRLHNREEYQGSGIGLAIVKLVMDKINGTVGLESKLGEGSHFILKLPK